MMEGKEALEEGSMDFVDFVSLEVMADFKILELCIIEIMMMI